VAHTVKELTSSQAAKLLGMDAGQLCRELKTGRYGPTRVAFVDGRRVRLLQVEAIERARGRIFTPRELEAVAGPQPDELSRRVFAAAKAVAKAVNEKWKWWLLTPDLRRRYPNGPAGHEGSVDLSRYVFSADDVAAAVKAARCDCRARHPKSHKERK
jgi:hypothetical protein